jgi:gluconate 2-dehydrogenase gamma chain
MDRRELFTIAAGAAAAAKVAGAQAHKFFTDPEFALVDELTEMVIPADEKSGGARAAKVAEYIDYRLSEAFEPADRDKWREGLKRVEELSVEMHSAAFLKSTPEQRVALMTRISAQEANPQRSEELFFRTLKDATIRAYYTSKTGIHDDMGYLGNVYQRGDYAGELP